MSNRETSPSDIDEHFEDVMRQGGIDPATFGEGGPMEPQQIIPFGVTDVMTSLRGLTAIKSQEELQAGTEGSAERVYSDTGVTDEDGNTVLEVDQIKDTD
jgi:hypothetical protein